MDLFTLLKEIFTNSTHIDSMARILADCMDLKKRNLVKIIIVLGLIATSILIIFIAIGGN